MHVTLGASLVSAAVAVVGVVAYAIASNAKAQEIGRLAFAVGLLALLLSLR